MFFPFFTQTDPWFGWPADVISVQISVLKKNQSVKSVQLFTDFKYNY